MAHGWLPSSDAWLRRLLARPELALLAESCPTEVALQMRPDVADKPLYLGLAMDTEQVLKLKA